MNKKGNLSSNLEQQGRISSDLLFFEVSNISVTKSVNQM